MSAWLYQINQKSWTPNRYRIEIWENERWSWPLGTVQHGGTEIKAGDIVIFFYAPYGGDDPGFYGWAVITEYLEGDNPEILFKPVSPSNYLKMTPWWDEDAKSLVDKIRGGFKQKTLWIIDRPDLGKIRTGIRNWLAGKN